MNSVLLPHNNEGGAFDPKKCFVSLDQIERLISECEQRLEKLAGKYDQEPDAIKRRGVGDAITRTEGKMAALKEIRHMAYVAGGYRE